jgi:hypothetical protein
MPDAPGKRSRGLIFEGDLQDVRFWPIADIRSCTAQSAFVGKADMTVCGNHAFAVAIGGKADMAYCSANVRL